MKNFHLLSFGIGLITGVVLLFVCVGGFRVLHPRTATINAGTFQQNGGRNLSRMAQRMGITQEELQKELDSGKTMQQIGQEHGVQMGNGFGGRTGSGSVRPTGTGSAMNSAASLPATPTLGSSSAQ